MIWTGDEPPEHKKFVEDLKAFTKPKYALGLVDRRLQSIVALADGIKKAGNTKSDDVAKALLGLTFDTPVGKRTFSAKSHETFAPEYWGDDDQGSGLSLRRHEEPGNAAGVLPDQLTTASEKSSPAGAILTRAAREPWEIDRRWRPRFCSASSWAA